MNRHAETLKDELAELIEREEDEDDTLDAAELERLAELRDFEESIPDWYQLIHEDDFEDHARSFADELGIDTSAWPASCIDWKDAADELRHDYTCYELDGDTFYARD